MKKTIQMIFAAASVVFLAACGGGDAVSDAGGYMVESGVAQKGPLAQGSVVTVDELTSATLKPNGKGYTFRTYNNLGTFSTSGITFGSSYLSTLASGYYYNEITGAQSNDIVVLSGLSQIGTGGDTVINVNALSSMALDRVTKLATTSPIKTFAVARTQAQRELLAAFYIYNGTSILTGTTVNNIAQPANLTALDLSKSRAGDQILAAMSGVVMTAGVNGNGVNTLLSQIAVDLGDDGLLNNSVNYTISVSTRLCAATAETNYATIAANLNNLYGTKYNDTDLSQWVDTSGCIDKVIDKFKYIGASPTSPSYAVKSEDIGQCFSASVGTLKKNGVTVNTANTKAVAGDSFSITVPSVAISKGFIQRSPTDISGNCPANIPSSGLVRVLKYSAAVVTTFAGSGLAGSVDGYNNFASFRHPSGVAVDAIGNAYISDGENNIIRKINTLGNVTTLAGSQVQGNHECKSVPANYNGPVGIAVDSAGYVYVSYRCSHKIAKISPTGLTTILAGSGVAGDADGLGASASFNNPISLTLDKIGNLYVADYYNHKIRKITPSGQVTTFAGSGKRADIDGFGLAASFFEPDAIAIDANGNLYVTEWSGNRVRKVSPAGVVTTLAGNGTSGETNGLGSLANFRSPQGIAVDKYGNVFVSEVDGNRIRMITPSGFVSTLAGTRTNGSTNGFGETATFSRPCGVAVNPEGGILIADCANNKIRQIKF